MDRGDASRHGTRVDTSMGHVVSPFVEEERNRDRDWLGPTFDAGDVLRGLLGLYS